MGHQGSNAILGCHAVTLHCNEQEGGNITVMLPVAGDGDPSRSSMIAADRHTYGRAALEA